MDEPKKPDPMVERLWATLGKLSDVADPSGPCFFVHREPADDPEVRIDAVLPLDKLAALLWGDRADRAARIAEALTKPAWQVNKLWGRAWVVQRTTMEAARKSPYFGPFDTSVAAWACYHRLISEQILDALEAPSDG